MSLQKQHFLLTYLKTHSVDVEPCNIDKLNSIVLPVAVKLQS